ncbi:MAG: galactokinase [Aggregatilineales bacterium]
MTLQDKVISTYRTRFKGEPEHLVRAPGRVNLIGEHTDYNDGFVLPMAINRASWIALSPRDDTIISVYSIDFDEQIEFNLTDLRQDTPSWAEYVKGVTWALQEANYTLKGWQGVIAGDVPIGAGLSSSAALELAVARASLALNNASWNAAKMAKLAQHAENDWVGVKCGIMDQMISAAGKSDHALLIDCRSLETQLAPLPTNTVVVVMDTGTRRGLVDSAYNERRAQCEAAAKFFNVPALRDLDIATFEREGNKLDDIIRRRARHIITENDRVLEAKIAMDNDDAQRLGQLMYESHISLRDDFEVSSNALNTMVEIAQTHEGCIGARMTGAGFGGCAVALVDASYTDDFVKNVSSAYQEQLEIQPSLYVCKATNGAEIIQ